MESTNITRKFIFKNTKRHAVNAFIYQSVMILSLVIVLTSRKEGFERYFVPIAFIIMWTMITVFETRGYFLDLIIKKIKFIEGKGSYVTGIPIMHKVCGTEIRVVSEDGKKVNLYYYDTLRRHWLDRGRPGPKDREVYYYLKFSKIVVDMKYIPVKIEKGNETNKMKNVRKRKNKKNKYKN